MILSSHQPDFFPYMGYFYKMFQSDVFVFSDNVLYSKSGRHDYNKILTANGPKKYKIPIHYHLVNLNDMKIAADDKTVLKMIKTLWMEYRRAKNFDVAFPVIEELLSIAPKSVSLATFNANCIMTLAHKFGLADNRDFHLSSNLDLKGKKDERIINMCVKLKADVYYSGEGARAYHDKAVFADNGIRLAYTDYDPVEYEQINTPGGEFEYDMSVIDYVMNCGFELPRGWKRYE